MSRPSKVWWNSQKGTWCSDLGGKRHTLAKGRGNKNQAERALKKLLVEQTLLRWSDESCAAVVALISGDAVVATNIAGTIFGKLVARGKSMRASARKNSV